VRVPRAVVLSLAAVVVAHSWVLAAVRESVPESYRLLLADGIQLPWLTVLKRTMPQDAPLVTGSALPIAILSVTVLLIGALWRFGARPGGHRKENSVWASSAIIP